MSSPREAKWRRRKLRNRRRRRLLRHRFAAYDLALRRHYSDNWKRIAKLPPRRRPSLKKKRIRSLVYRKSPLMGMVLKWSEQ